MARTRVLQWAQCVVLAAAFFMATVLTLGSNAAATPTCRPVSGHFVTQPTDLDGDPDTPDFAGPVNGSIQGRFEARNLRLIDTSTEEDQATPAVFLFTERLDLIAERGFLRGTTLKTIGEGAFDVVSGLFTEILTIIKSVGEEWISGQLFLFGDFDPDAGIGDGDYRGQICFGTR